MSVLFVLEIFAWTVNSKQILESTSPDSQLFLGLVVSTRTSSCASFRCGL